MDISSDTNRWNEILTSLMIANCRETNVPDDQESASMVSDVNSTNSIVQQSASDESSTDPVEQSSIQHNIENGLSATNLEQIPHHQINPYFNQTFNQWYSNNVFHPTSYSATDPFHRQSDSSTSLYRSSGNISDTWGMDNYSSAYSVYNKHLEPSSGAAYDTQKYTTESAYFPPRPEHNIIQPTNVQRDVQLGDQQQMNRQFNDQMATTLTEFSSTIYRSGNRSLLRPRIHKCSICSTAYTSLNHLNRHFRTDMHLKELKKKGFRS